LLEAMALGVPVVSTAVMGTKEVLAGGGGALIAEDDETDFADKTVRLLTDPALRARLAVEAVEHARSWSAPVLAERMLQFYRKVIERRGCNRATIQRSIRPPRQTTSASEPQDFGKVTPRWP
ncbi:MAG: glycosyltransferase family 4 protein, partial [Rhodospirillales bacterium]|nr:glycosyltransferase family 4 protein [Rhodospirillales bacterium]